MDLTLLSVRVRFPTNFFILKRRRDEEKTDSQGVLVPGNAGNLALYISGILKLCSYYQLNLDSFPF